MLRPVRPWPYRCQVKMGTPQNGDPVSPFSYEVRDPGPQFPNILGTLGSPISYDIRDPSMKLGTPIFFRLFRKILPSPFNKHCWTLQFQLTCMLEEYYESA